MPSLRDRLTEILINNKLITNEQLEQAIQIQRQKGGRLSDIIVELKFIKESDLLLALSQGLGLPPIDLKRFKIDPEVTKLIPADVARHFQIIPVSKMGDTLTLSMADPLNIFAIDHVKGLTRHKINPIIASPQDITQAIETYYPDNTKSAIDNLIQEMKQGSIEFIREEKEASPSSQELNFVSRQAPVVKFVNMLIESAVEKKASDILIEPLNKSVRQRFRLDGILQEQEAFPKSMHAPVVSRIKVIANMDIAEHRLPQDGRFKAMFSGREIDFRVSVLPSSFGEKVALRILDKSANVLDIDKLGFSHDTAEKLKIAARFPHGMILVCGPTGSGKTTTIYSLLKYVDSPEKNIVTVEDPVEYQLEGINQVTVRQDIGLSFAAALRSILRQDPNVIMIGEIRDYDTVDIGIKSALTGHLVLSTLHATTAAGAVARLINMRVEPYLINASVISTVSQRLLRKICQGCREEYKLSGEAAASLKMKIEPGSANIFYRGKGCPRCFNSGYSGRVGIAEVLMLSGAIRELILGHAQEREIRQQARKEGMKTLREEGMGLALSGATTLEEVLKATMADD